MPIIDYKAFIEENFDILTKEGEVNPFIFNDTQNYAYNLLLEDNPEFQGIRENWLKFRQWGGSSLVVGLFTVDFILSELGEIPITNSDIYSHKDEETYTHFSRASFYYESWLKRAYHTDDPKDITKLRKSLLKEDETGNKMVGLQNTTIETKTASAKVSGRGGTKQNQLYTEIAFYPYTEIMNAKKLVVGASEQVKDGYGKIIRETTGNLSGDFFHTEYEFGKQPESEYKSRFFGWYLHKDYQRPAPDYWNPPDYYHKILDEGNANLNQCYWHFRKTKMLTDKEKMREYPTYDVEAFLMSGEMYFENQAVLHYVNNSRQPLYTGDNLITTYATL